MYKFTKVKFPDYTDPIIYKHYWSWAKLVYQTKGYIEPCMNICVICCYYNKFLVKIDVF